MDATIRPATLEDLDAIVQLNEMVQQFHVENEPAYFKAPNREEARAWFAEFLSHPHAKLWIAERHGTCIGYVVAETMERPSTAFFPRRHWCEVHQIGVVPEHRREGVAQGLIETVLRMASESGLREVQLSTWEFNTEARRAFVHLGFVPSLTRLVRTVDGTDRSSGD